MAEAEQKKDSWQWASDYLKKNWGMRARGYIISEGALVDALSPHLQSILSLGEIPKVFEVGAGAGVSTDRMLHEIKRRRIRSVDWTATEVSLAQIDSGKGRKSGVNVIRADAQDLHDFKDASYHAVVSEQAIHWVPDIVKSLQEQFRVLMPGGLFLAMSSGLVKGGEPHHFTKHPTYKKFHEYVEEHLTQRGCWIREKNGFLKPENIKVNSFFHRYSVDDLINMIKKVGFTGASWTYHRVPVNTREMFNVRMNTGSAFMFLFKGPDTEQISKEIADESVRYARKKMILNHPLELLWLSVRPSGDAALRFRAMKPLI